MHYLNCGVSCLQVKLSQRVYKTSDGMMQTVLLALFPGPFPAFFAYSTNNLVQIFMLVICIDRKVGRNGFDCVWVYWDSEQQGE